jgi:hypothetical protein
MRPRFSVEVACGVEDVMKALRGRLEDNAQGLSATYSRRHGVLEFPEEQRHFWSPRLSLTVDALDEAGDRTRVSGLFSPHPHIWQAFVFSYGVLFILGFFGLMYGFAELALGRTPWAMLVSLGSGVLAAFVYGATFIGQGLGAEEMYRLRAYLDEGLEAAQASHAARPKTAGESAQL